MDFSDFKPVKPQQKQEIYGGALPGLFVGIVASLPAIVSAVASLAASFKTLFSDSGEIKTKEGLTQKWDTKSGKELKNPLKPNAHATMPIYFIY
ncbi:hypothetical protein ACW95P_04140 [Candidatus Mycoplasma pogonae]